MALPQGDEERIYQQIASAVVSSGGNDEDLSQLSGDVDKLRQIGKIIVRRPTVLKKTEFFFPLSDAEVPDKHRSSLTKYRSLAEKQDVLESAPVCYSVRDGFTLKRHAPLYGPCFNEFREMYWSRFCDKPTSNCLVFWVPCLLADSTALKVSHQLEMLSNLRTRLGLPSHHMSSFGEASLVAGLILTHFRMTGERIPRNHLLARTDTFHQNGGDRYCIGSFYTSLNYDQDHCGGVDDRIGAFALGVEQL